MKKAFTLVELLVVIAIIAMLLGVLLPAINKAREQAKSTICKSRLSQLFMAAILWAENNDGWSPPASWSWPNPMKRSETTYGPNPGALQRYSSTSREGGALYVCPSSTNLKWFKWTGAGSGNQDSDVTYAINGWMAFNPSSEGLSPGTPASSTSRSEYGEKDVYWTEHGVTKLINVRIPKDTVFFIDHEFYAVTKKTFNPFIPPEMLVIPTLTRWHNKRSSDYYGKGNIAWVDGHVSIEPSDLSKPIVRGEKIRWQYYFFDH